MASRRAFLAAAAGLVARAQARRSIRFKTEPGRIQVLAGEQLLTTYDYRPELDKPSLYPIYSLSGTELTRGFPENPRPGESTDHPWHCGIWYGHGDINGHDFWRELGRDKTGREVVTAEPEIRTNPPQISARIDLQPPTGDPIGSVDQHLTFSAAPAQYSIRARITIHADRGVPLTFGDTDDGGFGIRLRDEFRQDRGAILINSEGLRGTENIWGKPAKWVDYSTTVGGGRFSVKIEDHPDNLRHPTTWHARGYGLCSANPFATRSFTGNPDADGSYTVAANQVLTLRYTVVIRQVPGLPSP